MLSLALALTLFPPDPGRAFVAAHCASCHAGDKPKGGVRLDALSADFTDKTNRDRWAAALEQVKAGTMPPEKRPRPDPKQIAALTAWADARETARRAAQGRTVARRLNRVEYENTVRDLLGVEIVLKEQFPADATANGFDTSGDAHHVSAFLMDSYLEAADKALAVAIANGPRPAFAKKRYSIADERGVKVSTEKVFRKDESALVMFSSSAWNAITVGQFYPSERGRYRIRISAQAIQNGDKPVAFRVDAGPMLMGTKSHLVDYFDAPPDAPKVFEFVDHFEARDHIRISPYGLAVAQTVSKIGADVYTGPGLAVQWVEVEGPLHDAWPPACHTRLFGDLPQGPAPAFNNRTRVEVVSKNPEADAATILKKFARRTFRRTVTDADVTHSLELVKSRLAEGYSFERAVRVGLKAVMVSPSFLFLEEKPGKLDDFA
ncbi:MAG TPA: DUF1587 domain-containing protein, partial [Gemmataceae bacterium]|nr:DUF1587 domain-containing protein [Gemmataceae bacterium]